MKEELQVRKKWDCEGKVEIIIAARALKALLLAALTLFLLAVNSQAQPSKYEIDGGIMGMVLDRADNLWGNGNRSIRSLYAKPDSKTLALPMPFLTVKFTPGGNNAKNPVATLYFDTAMEPGSLSLGARRRFRKSFIDVYGFYSLVAKNWQNPYTLYRTSTNTTVAGGKVTYGNIFDTNLSVSYRVAHTSLDKDLIGDLNGDLRQNGTAHDFDIGYRLSVTERVSVIPTVSYGRGAFNGASNSYDRYQGGIAVSVKMSSCELKGLASAGNARFDRTHPVFMKTRDEDTYTVGITATIPEPFGWKRYTLSAGMSRTRTGSSITFFERNATIGYLGLAYRF